MDLTCDPEKPDYAGTVRITLEVKQATNALRFHARALTIDRAALAGAANAACKARSHWWAIDQT